jgi:tetratricopeptide (TPR) repeat protein/transcriptional regulator with XRE-family HTH domain
MLSSEDPSPASEGLGGLLRDLRWTACLTQEELARRAGISVRTISDLERGQTTRPYRRSARLIADALALSGQVRNEFLIAAGGHPGIRTSDRSSPGREPGPGKREPGPSGAGQPGVVVPRQLPGDQWRFTGRTNELRYLDALADHHDDGEHWPRLVVISGAPGVGKTALAVHWAHQVTGRFPHGQLYVNLRGFDPSAAPVSSEAALRTLLDALDVPQSRIPASLDAQAGLYRSLLAGRQFLIVLDNAFDAAQVRSLLPGSATCLAIVTSRSELTSLVAADGAQLMTLDVFTDDEALEMVASRLGRERVSRERHAAQEMIGLCARLPLALGIAVARAAVRPGFPLTVLVNELKDAGSRLDALEADESATSVRTVFSWSYHSLSDQAARIFRLLSEQPGPDISVPAAASLAGLPRQQAISALREVARSHLVSEHTPGRFAFHDLLRAFASEQSRARESDDERRAAWQRLLDHYLHTCSGAARVLDPTRDPIPLGAMSPGVRPELAADYEQSWSWLQAEYPVLLALVDKAAAVTPGRSGWQIPWLLQTFLFRRGHWQDYVMLQRTAVDIAARLAETDGQAHSHHGLGRACGLIGSYQAAAEHLAVAVSLYQELGEKAAEARCRIDLGHLASRQGNYGTALQEALLAEDLYRVAGHRPGQAGALNNMGWYHLQLGDHASALDYCQRALANFEEVGNQHGAATSLASLGSIYHRTGDSSRGVEHCQAALRCFQEHGDLPSQAELLNQLGEMHQVNDSRAAIESWHQAAVIYTQLDHPDAAVLRRKLQEFRVALTEQRQQPSAGANSVGSP